MTVVPPFKKASRLAKNRFANRGEAAEKAVQKALEAWADESPQREANRLTDSKAAGRIIKAAPADFEFYCLHKGFSLHGLIEVKETQHEYRLDRSRLTQHARLRRRAKCGGFVFVLVYHSTTKLWRCMDQEDLGPPGLKGSWDLRPLPTFATPREALAAKSEGVVS